MKTIFAVVIFLTLAACGQKENSPTHVTSATSPVAAPKNAKEAATPHFKAYVPDETVRKNPKF